VVASVVGVFPLAASATGGASRLSGVAGPGFTITLKSGTTLVKALNAGSYTLVIADKSSIHNFHLFGPGVNKKTSVPFTGTQTWSVTLKPGTYTYQCDIHAATGMKATFKVT
jgi:plastocyanin